MESQPGLRPRRSDRRKYSFPRNGLSGSMNVASVKVQRLYQYLTRAYLVCSSRRRHCVGEINRELYRKPRRLALLIPNAHLHGACQQLASNSSISNGRLSILGAHIATICIFSEWGVIRKFFGLLLACNQVLLVLIGRRWPCWERRFIGKT